MFTIAALSSPLSISVKQLPLNKTTAIQMLFVWWTIHSFIHFPFTFPGEGQNGNRLTSSVQTYLGPATDSSSSGGLPRCYQANYEI